MPEPEELALALTLLTVVFMLAPIGVLLVVLLAWRTRRRERDAHERREHLLLLERALAMAESERIVRKRLAADLHDEMGLHFSILMSMARDSRELAKRGKPIKLDAIIDQGELFVERMQALMERIRTDQASEENPLTALHEIVRVVRCSGNLSLYFDCPNGLPPLDADCALFLRCMLQEALNNIIKHAQAGKAWVSINIAEHQLILTVEDDGKGFDTTATGKGHGLNNFRQRCALLGGSFACDSQPGQRTKLVFRIPWTRTEQKNEQNRRSTGAGGTRGRPGYGGRAAGRPPEWPD